MVGGSEVNASGCVASCSPWCLAKMALLYICSFYSVLQLELTCQSPHQDAISRGYFPAFPPFALQPELFFK